MKYFKLVWLIMSGRLRLEGRNGSERLDDLTAADDVGQAFARIN